MKLSTERILTTHVGSLPRSQEVVDLLFAQDRGDAVDEAQVLLEALRALEEHPVLAFDLAVAACRKKSQPDELCIG